METSIGNTIGLNSELIYNTNKIDLIEFYNETENNLLTPDLFPHINQLLSTCGQSLFDKNDELTGIPKEYIQPPIKITKNIFKIDISENTEKNYIICSLHSPLNITLNTVSPIGWLLNSKTIYNQFINLFILLSRTPIFYINGKTTLVLNFFKIMQTKETVFNAFFDEKDISKMDKNIDELYKYLLKPRSQIYTTLKDTIKRLISEKEEENCYYSATYSDGQFTGFTSPQANDYYKDLENLNVKSDFNNSSFLKCLFQITLLGITYSNNNKYTLDNACILICKTKDGFKFTGKYWKKTFSDDVSSTLEIINNLKNRITNDPKIVEKIKTEIDDCVSTDALTDKNMAWNIKNEDLYPLNTNLILFNKVVFSKRLFNCTLGLEDYDKINFALSISGILGHSWDYLLRFFRFQQSPGIEQEIKLIKQFYPNFNFLKHIGTPLASYLFDYKNISETQLLGGYNANEFNKTLNKGLLRIRDNVRGTKIYEPLNYPNCLFPVTFNNLLLTCETKCYRSYKKLLNFMKTRKQRNLLFDNLNQYGRRCMTVLDPYGIFMHFQDEKRALASQD